MQLTSVILRTPELGVDYLVAIRLGKLLPCLLDQWKGHGIGAHRILRTAARESS
jgi:hypothetical protein